MKKTIFMQSRNPNAPKEGLGQVYMPTAILSAMARVIQAGGEVDFLDANIRPITASDVALVDVVGMHSVGPSWIPSTLQLQEEISVSRPDMLYLQGGQVISSLDQKPFVDAPNFNQVFGPQAVNGNSDAVLARELGLDVQALPNASETSLIPAYRKLDDEVMKLYLENPFSLYVSQGCQFVCNFCSAVRTKEDPDTGKPVRARETYRDISIIQIDLEYLCAKAEDFGIRELTMYMSNLDVCQTPDKLDEFAKAVQAVKANHPTVDIHLTALSTVSSFVNMHKEHQGVLERIREAGLVEIAFGVEGMSEGYWKALKKGHNKEDDCYNAIKDAGRLEFAAEVLLTPGHANETEETLNTTIDYARHMKARHGATIRPYAAKPWSPGNDGWIDPRYATGVRAVLAEPALFQNLDYNALQSTLVEPDPHRRAMVNDAFKTLCELSDGAAPFLLPVEPGMSHEEKMAVQGFNEGRYDH